MAKLPENKIKETLSTHFAEIAEELNLEGIIMITVSHSEETEHPDLFDRDLKVYLSKSLRKEIIVPILENVTEGYKEKSEIDQ